MNSRILLGLALLAGFLPGALHAATFTLNPTADAYVRDGTNADWNYGTINPLQSRLSPTSGKNYDSYLKFDAASAAGAITSAKLRFYYQAQVVSTLYAVADTGWLEADITWNNKPARGGTLGSLPAASSYAWGEIDVTGYVQSERTAGRGVLSFALHNTVTSTINTTVASRESANAPQLVIETAANPNIPPNVDLTSPSNGQRFSAPASINLTATASDGDGSIDRVEFYSGASLIGTAPASPYTFTWTEVAAGSYSLTAKAFDNGGASTTSAAVTISVDATSVTPGIYYIYADHLNTPRTITDTSNNVVWQWDSDPFGTDLPVEATMPGGARFNYNLRFPGQYFDKETGLHYNWHRYYSPGTGNYAQSDPLGLGGGSLSTYTYAKQSPLSFIDPLGLSACGPGYRAAPAPGNEKNFPQVALCVPDPGNDPKQKICASSQCLLYGANQNPKATIFYCDSGKLTMCTPAVVNAGIDCKKCNPRTGPLSEACLQCYSSCVEIGSCLAEACEFR